MYNYVGKHLFEVDFHLKLLFILLAFELAFCDSVVIDHDTWWSVHYKYIHVMYMWRIRHSMCEYMYMWYRSGGHPPLTMNNSSERKVQWSFHLSKSFTGVHVRLNGPQEHNCWLSCTFSNQLLHHPLQLWLVTLCLGVKCTFCTLPQKLCSRIDEFRQQAGLC